MPKQAELSVHKLVVAEWPSPETAKSGKDMYPSVQHARLWEDMTAGNKVAVTTHEPGLLLQLTHGRRPARFASVDEAAGNFPNHILNGVSVKPEQANLAFYYRHHGYPRYFARHSNTRFNDEIIINLLTIRRFHVIQKHLEFTILTRQTPAKRWFVLLFFLVHHGASPPSHTFP